MARQPYPRITVPYTYRTMHIAIFSWLEKAVPSPQRVGAFLVLILVSLTAMAIEEPNFKVIARSETFELRQYGPMLIAETIVSGDMDGAGSTGFRKIADYIFGNNQMQSGTNSAKIAMTAPVTMEPQSQKIEMTAPVMLAPSDNGASATQWRVQFVMPSQYTMSNIPQPKNPDVKLREIAGKLFAVNRFTGFNTQSKVKSKSDALLEWIAQNNWKPLGPSQLARYDPPWTLPMFRRNEVMIEVQELQAQTQ